MPKTTQKLIDENYDEEKMDCCSPVENSTSTIYSSARRALHSASPNEMPGREKELLEISDFINHLLSAQKSGTLYISGPPGTGKTASLNLVLEEHKEINLKHVYINCTAMKSSTAIYSRIGKEMGFSCTGRAENCAKTVEKHIEQSRKMTLLVLDEMDQLESKKQSVLYTIFEWPAKIKKKLILIGIANALDLTDRILPRLQANCTLKPHLMHFAPYTKLQLVDIFTKRLKTIDGASGVFAPAAVQMLAAKVAAVSGDARRALDIGRRAIDLVEDEENIKEGCAENDEKYKKRPVLHEENAIKMPHTKATTQKNSNVDVKRVVRVLNCVYGDTTTQMVDPDEHQNDDGGCGGGFPLQQKIVLCVLVLILERANNKDVTLGRLHEVYRRVCAKQNIQYVDQAEFVALLGLIEVRGAVRVVKKRELRLSRVCLVWDVEGVVAALNDGRLMATILQDESSLKKM